MAFMCSTGRTIYACVVLLALLTPTYGAERVSAARQAAAVVARFFDAFQAGDAAVLREVIFVDPGSIAQTMGRQAYVDLIAGERRLERVAAARFGADGDRFRCGADMIITETDRRGLANPIFRMENEANGARIILEGQTLPLRLRRSLDGNWRVVVAFIDTDFDDDPVAGHQRPDPVSQIRIDRVRASAEAINAVASSIERGDFTSAAAAEDELLSRRAAIVADFEKRLAALPERYRWGRDLRY